MDIKINFVIGELSAEEFDALLKGYAVIAKMILTPDDQKLFRYKEGDSIEVETGDGNRLWCTIQALETIKSKDEVLHIFTLRKSGEH